MPSTSFAICDLPCSTARVIRLTLSEDQLEDGCLKCYPTVLMHCSLMQNRSMKEVGLKLPVGLSGSSSRKVAMGVDPSGMYKVVSSRAHVKKTESSQQTDNSAFK